MTRLLTPGTVLRRRYKIIAPVGRGGMGAVYRAEDLRLQGRICAIKEVRPDPDATPEAPPQAQEQFRRAAFTLARLDQGERAALTLRYYELHLLDFMGYRPQLFTCVACGALIRPEPQYFSVAQGGVLCPQCGVHFQDARPISVEALKYLRHLQRSPFAQARRARPTAQVWQEMEQVLQRYITTILERQPNTARFLRRLRGTG